MLELRKLIQNNFFVPVVFIPIFFKNSNITFHPYMIMQSDLATLLKKV